MTAQPLELEGTWEEIIAHGPELAGRRVRITAIADEPEFPSPEKQVTTLKTVCVLFMKLAVRWSFKDGIAAIAVRHGLTIGVYLNARKFTWIINVI